MKKFIGNEGNLVREAKTVMLILAVYDFIKNEKIVDEEDRHERTGRVWEQAYSAADDARQHMESLVADLVEEVKDKPKKFKRKSK